MNMNVRLYVIMYVCMYVCMYVHCDKYKDSSLKHTNTYNNPCSSHIACYLYKPSQGQMGYYHLSY